MTTISTINLRANSTDVSSFSTKKLIFGMIKSAFVALIIAVLALSALSDYGIWLIVASILLSIVLLIHIDMPLKDKAICVLSIAVVIGALNYVGWRIQLINYQGWWIGIPLFLAELFGSLHTMGLQLTIWPQPEGKVTYDANPFERPIYVFIPTVNEGVDVLKATIDGVLRARNAYLAIHSEGSIDVIICNDGYVANYSEWEEIEILAASLGVTCITRRISGGAKAGNIENARQMIDATGKALIAILDADQIPHADFFLRLIPPFADSKVGWVQSGQYYTNTENTVASWSHDQQALFYGILCPGKSRRNAAFICGTNVVISAEALDSIGGLPQNSVTEDFAASIELHPYWRGVFVDGQLADGLGPMDLKSYFKQQRRWATGTLTVLKTHWHFIFLPWNRGLSLQQRVQYALACTHYLTGIRDFVYTIAPILFMVTGIPAVRGSDINAFLIHFIPYYLASQAAFWFIAYKQTGLRGIVIGYASFPSLLQAALTAVTGRKIGFQVTSKSRLNASNLHEVRPHILLLLLSIAALIFGWWHIEDKAALVVTSIWLLYQIGMFLAIIWLAVVDDLGFVKSNFQWNIFKQIFNLTKLKYMSVLSPVIVIGIFVILLAPPRPELKLQNADELLKEENIVFGLSTPLIWVNERPKLIEETLHIAPKIVGRTQDITDYFDVEWAKSITSSGATPFVNLIFEAPGFEPHKASLPAVANGYHDENLYRWAKSIAEYQQPVYLSVLQHVDKNWVQTSAVANGGIPSDSARAWVHIRSIFEKIGTNNVLWVWAPAEVAKDVLFAPPLQEIDLVLLTITNFPDTKWQTPKDLLISVNRKYPTKRIIVQFSSNADDPQHATAYLASLEESLPIFPNVHAVIYYEGSPQGSAAIEEHQKWSLLVHPTVSEAAISLVDSLVSNRSE